MRTITKGAEPASLTGHRCSSHANYDNYSDKDALRRALVSEQRGLCCYCLSRIDTTQMKIEHWHCQRKYPTEQLDYANLLGACMGNEGLPRHRQHCDTRKGDEDLSINPAYSLHRVEDRIQFRGDGLVVSDDTTLDAELNQVLNLNEAFLINNRKKTLEGFTQGLRKLGALQRPALERMLREWNGEGGSGRLRPFCQVIVYWLRKRLARA